MKRAILGVTLIGLATVLASSCGFLLPQRGHENPLDPESPVALVVSFTAQSVSVDATANKP